jgi:hypothetical protein
MAKKKAAKRSKPKRRTKEKRDFSQIALAVVEKATNGKLRR